MSSRSRRSLRSALRAAAGLTGAEWITLAGAAALLPATALALKLATLARLLPVVRALARERREAGGAAEAGRILRLVHAAAGWCVPSPTCLATALVAFVLLRRRALPARLVIGVTKAHGVLQGHAWVDLAGDTAAAVATGGYVPLVVLAGSSSSSGVVWHESAA